MSEWKEVTLKEAGCKFLSGYAFKSEVYSDRGIPLIKIGNIQNKVVSIDPYGTFIKSDLITDKLSKYLLCNEDILIAMTGQGSVGRVGKLQLAENQKALLNQRVGKFITANSDVNIKYLYYVLASPSYQEYLFNTGSGSGQPNLSPELILETEVILPPLPEQERIAEVLSSLDDKIDLLHRQNKTLEEMAETLFRQWFVEEAEEDSNPYICLSELVDTISETHKFLKGGAIFLNTSDIYQGAFLTNQFINKEILPGQAKKSIKKGDILFSEIRPSNGRWAFVDFTSDDYVVSTKLMVIRSKGRVSPEFIYFYLTHKTTVDYLQMIAESRSGTFPQITFEQIKPLKIKVPAEKILKEAELWCTSVLDKILFNKKQIQQLETLRDTLLPKLMSGSVTVNEIA